MKSKVWPYVLFAVISLCFAYYASTPKEAEVSAGEIWAKIPAKELESITYKNDTLESIFTPASSGYVWVNTKTKRKEGEVEHIDEERFLVGDRFEEVQKALDPFRVAKLIGKSKDLKLEEFGLDKPNGSLTVQYSKGKSLILDIGKRSFQSQQVFALDKAKAEVVLLDRAMIGLLEAPKARMAITKIYSFKDDDLAKVEVQAGDKKAAWQRERKGNQFQWLKSGQTEADEAFRNWLDKLLKLRVEGYAPLDKEASLKQAGSKFKVNLGGEVSNLDQLTFIEEVEGANSNWWLVSEKLPAPIRLDPSKVTVLVKDLQGFFQ